jgi:hypothetical protein
LFESYHDGKADVYVIYAYNVKRVLSFKEEFGLRSTCLELQKFCLSIIFAGMVANLLCLPSSLCEVEEYSFNHFSAGEGYLILHQACMITQGR